MDAPQQAKSTKPQMLPGVPQRLAPLSRRREVLTSAWSVLPEPSPAKFVLYAQGRSGSTLLGELLGSHDDVLFADEVLGRRVRHTQRYVDGLRKSPAARRRVYGFHVKVYQLSDTQLVADPREWLADCVARGWKVVYLRRRNYIRQALSNMTRREMNTSHFRTGDGLARPRLRIEPELFRQLVENRAITTEWEAATLAGIPHVAVEYERDLLDPARWDETTAGLFDHLGLAPRPVTTTLRKINTGPIGALVDNYEDIVSMFTGTQFEPLLDD
jgi:hypothetical protein